jgi:hypothetical protein
MVITFVLMVYSLFVESWHSPDPGNQRGEMIEIPSQGAFLSPSHFTTQLPSAGNPGALLVGPSSQPAAIIATA